MWVTPKEICEFAQISRVTLWRWKTEMLTVKKFARGVTGKGRGLRYDPEVFDEFLRWRGTRG